MKMNTKESTMVKPMADTPCGSLWLSNLDVLMPPNYHAQVVYFYRSNGAVNFFDPAALKAALSRALVEFYPYAGRLKRDHNNRIEIDCNAEGALFVEAECDATLDDFGDFLNPRPELRLIPAVDYSQGISAFPSPASAVNSFQMWWSLFRLCKRASLSRWHVYSPFCEHMVRYCSRPHQHHDHPSFLQSDPPQSTQSTAPQILPHRVPTPPPLKAPIHNSETTFSTFKLTRDQFEALKAECREDDEGNKLKYSSYEVLTGHVWRSVCGARRLPQDQETKLHIPVNGRSRLQPPLPLGFFGNVLFSATPVALCGEVVSNPLGFTVGKIHKAINRMDDEYLRSAIDELELNGDACSVNTSGAYGVKCPNFRVVSWVGLPFYKADFGWGKPVYVGPGAAPHEGKSYALSSPANDGSFYVAITLHKHHMRLFQKLLYQGTYLSKL